jgi:hypothetical protein
MTTIRVTMRNNSDARRADVLDDLASAKARHNGGKLVIVALDASDLARAQEMLDESHAVASYEVQS